MELLDMPKTYERDLEDELCLSLAENGWLYSSDDTGYDRERALFAQDVFDWLSDTQVAQWNRAIKPGTPSEEANRRALLDALTNQLDVPIENGGGSLKVLRGQLGFLGSKFQMCQLEPPTSLNASVVEMYKKVRVRIMRQVQFSPMKGDSRTIDLVLFVNGIPIATLELKTDFKQNVADAIRQYKVDRLPKSQPLLEFGRRALVHFAVSDAEVWMTTKLEGKDTYFLPFNKGNAGGAGNLPNPQGPATSYLWQEVLERHSWLNIVGSLMFSVSERTTDPLTGKVETSQTMRFPRYHQLDAINRIIRAVQREGVGNKYLIQHSAGSGKSNTIGWAAHRLARLHDESNRKIFDTVLVITDRNVLDSQLQRAVREIDGRPGLVFNVDKAAARQHGGAKSVALASALEERRLIIVVTIQTFPRVLHQISDNAMLADHKFAVIIDEAHSSQSGATAKKVREVLTAGGTEVDEDAEVDSEDVVNHEVAEEASANVSYFAFTATPKPKTVEIFGREDSDGVPRAFHVYSMKQAIEEGFILDVLRGYQTYRTAFQIAQNATHGVMTSMTGASDEQLVDESEASKAIKRFVRLHPTNIGQKVRIIVEHFLANVAGLLDGHAKAMVVTSERKHALRYKVEMDRYIADRGYNLKTLVAFSGSLKDATYGFDEPVTEVGMNDKGIASDLAAAFGAPEYRVMIVADKFQTGFDQPLLCAMYVDKLLTSITAVQTLSRLNRTFRKGNIEKDRTFILDFVNDTELVRSAFSQYYEEAQIESRTDPNLPHKIAVKLEQADIYTDDDVEAFYIAYTSDAASSHAALVGSISGPKDEFDRRYKMAIADEAQVEIERLDNFRKDVGTFVRIYDFMSQVYDYSGTGLEKLSIFLRELTGWLTPLRRSEAVDLSQITLRRVKLIDLGIVSLSLGGGSKLKPTSGAGSAIAREPRLSPLADIVERMNTLFAGEFDVDQLEAFVLSVVTLLADMPEVRERALANSEEQFVASERVAAKAVDAVLGSHSIREKLTALTLGGDMTARQAVELIKHATYRYIRAEDGGSVADGPTGASRPY